MMRKERHLKKGLILKITKNYSSILPWISVIESSKEYLFLKL